MSADVRTCEGRRPVDELMELMTERRFRHVPVVKDGGLTGIVSIGDVVKSRMSELRVRARPAGLLRAHLPDLSLTGPRMVDHQCRARNRRALVMTLTEDSAIAAAAIIGDSSHPNAG